MGGLAQVEGDVKSIHRQGWGGGGKKKLMRMDKLCKREKCDEEGACKAFYDHS